MKWICNVEKNWAKQHLSDFGFMKIGRPKPKEPMDTVERLEAFGMAGLYDTQEEWERRKTWQVAFCCLAMAVGMVLIAWIVGAYR